jgi:large subunit ribosomal protein L21
MKKLAVVKVGSKQYLVSENQEIVVDYIDKKEKEEILLETLAVFTDNGEELELEKDKLKQGVKAQIIEHGKGEKIRVAKFRAKVRYRKVKGFRPLLTKIKILKV